MEVEPYKEPQMAEPTAPPGHVGYGMQTQTMTMTKVTRVAPLEPPPQPPPPTTVVVQAPPVVMQPQIPYPQNQRGWTTGLCACCSDCGICLCGWCCPLCLTCSVSSHMGEGCCTGYCCGLLPLRVKLRTMLGITGSISEDACVTSCCGPCSLCQMEREMKNQGMY